MELFESYEDEFVDLSSGMKTKLHTLQKEGSTNGEELLIQFKNQLKEADDLIRSLTMATQDVPDKAKVQPKLKLYQTELQSLKDDCKKLEFQLSEKKDRNQLFSGAKVNDPLSDNSEMRGKVVNALDQEKKK